MLEIKTSQFVVRIWQRIRRFFLLFGRMILFSLLPIMDSHQVIFRVLHSSTSEWSEETENQDAYLS